MPNPPKTPPPRNTTTTTTKTSPPRNLILKILDQKLSSCSINQSISLYMRMSCNGCRVLRKGCSENCCIRPCLQWIKTSESQSNATLFLAKFYGRAGLLNLINAGPEHLRPSIFQSMLYEACGRIVNPIYGSVGLLWSGNWKLCQSAVEAILNGDPIDDISSEITAGNPNPLFKPYDIRHVFKDDQQLHKVVKTRNRFKRTSGSKITKPKPDSESAAEACNLRWKRRLYPEQEEQEITPTPPKEEKLLSRESSLSRDQESVVSVETGEGSVVNRIEMERVPDKCCNGDDDDEGLLHLNLNLTLGF